MTKNFTYVDNSNLYIEGCRVSAVRKQLPGAWSIHDAIGNRIIDFQWRLNYARLKEFVSPDTDSGLTTVWGSTSESVSTMIERQGFRVVSFGRNSFGKEKKVDVAIAHAITKDAYSGLIKKGVDEITLVAGDGDFIPVVEDLVAEGHILHIIFWAHASRELKALATKFIDLSPLHGLLTSNTASLGNVTLKTLH